MLEKPAAFDFAVTSPLTSNNLPEASVTAGSAAFVTEMRKYQANDRKCAELDWVSIPLVVETYRYRQRPSGLTSCLVVHHNCLKTHQTRPSMDD